MSRFHRFVSWFIYLRLVSGDVYKRQMEGCAKDIVAKAAEAGVKMTEAGATFPYGVDPHDSNIRIAPSFPTPEELQLATEIFVLSVKLVSIDKLLAE